jgi:hypothetical protein
MGTGWCMAAELPQLLTLPLLAIFIALPASAAWRRRRASREASDIAERLNAWAGVLLRDARLVPLEESLRLRLLRLRIKDTVLLQMAEETARGAAPVVAESAQRLALRLRRRVAFERKMLARTASGLRRGAVVAAIPPLVLLVMSFAGLRLPAPLLMTLLLLELAGCVLLWRLARVEI